MNGHPQATRRAPNAIRIGTARATERQWAQSATPQLAIVKPLPPTRADRFAEACWRLHDGMPFVWALLFALFLMTSAGITVLLLAFALGWRP